MVKRLVVMGVSGSGKSTFGEALAQHLKLPFYDADDFHSSENKQKMASGTPLNDNDRKPWLEKLARLLAEKGENGVVLACSALKEKYRETLAGGSSNPNGVTFIYLKGEKTTLTSRLVNRSSHFLDDRLLDSQLATLEEPKNAICLLIENTVESNVKKAIEQL